MGGTSPPFVFDVVPTEARHGCEAYDVTSLANGYPLDAERRARHARFVAEQVERFPEGQFVAVTRVAGAERVIGAASTMRTRRPPTDACLPWLEMIGGYGLPHHDPDGSWLYGVEIAVHPAFQRRGVASALYAVRLSLVTELRLKGWYAGGMLMGYHRYADSLTPREYGERVIAGDLYDPTVSMQMRRGLVPHGVIEGYYPEPKAGGCAVLLTFLPPPARAPAPRPKSMVRRLPGAASVRPAPPLATDTA
jgi:GNAT superfamily N-acetyltransferase